MHTLGIIASHRKREPFKITSRLLPWYSYDGHTLQAEAALEFYEPGRFHYRNNMGIVQYPAGEWKAAWHTQESSIYFEVRITVEAGVAPSGPSLFGQWFQGGYSAVPIRYNLAQGVVGRVLVEIRRPGVNEIVASARLWTQDYAP